MKLLNHSTLAANSSKFQGLKGYSAGAHGLISRVRIFQGGNLLQDIDNYGLLCKFLMDMTAPTDACFGKLNILAGTRADYKLVAAAGGVNAVAATTDVTATVNQVNVNAATASIVTNVNAALNLSQVMSINTGDLIGDIPIYAAGPPIVGVVTKTYCLNLVSLVGSLCSNNYLPLFAMTSAPLRVEILLTDSVFKSFSAQAWTTSTSVLTNVEYIGNFIELSDNAMTMVQSSLGGGPLQFVLPDYRNFQYSYQLTTAAAQVNMPIPAKFSSLKSLYVMARDKGTGIANYFPLSTVKLSLNSYYFRLGSLITPAKAPSTTVEFFSELLKSVGSMSDLNHQPSIDLRSYAYDTSAANSINGITSSGSFYIGLDLENWASAPKDQIFSGWNSNTDDIYVVLDYPAQASAINVRYDAYAMFDTLLICDNNTAFVKF